MIASTEFSVCKMMLQITKLQLLSQHIVLLSWLDHHILDVIQTCSAVQQSNYWPDLAWLLLLHMDKILAAQH